MLPRSVLRTFSASCSLHSKDAIPPNLSKFLRESPETLSTPPLKTQQQVAARESQKHSRRKVLKYYCQKNIQLLCEKEVQRIATYNLVARWPIKREQIVESADWLSKNIPIRVAHMIYGFRRLPFVLGCNEDIQEVHEKYISSLDKLMVTIKDPTNSAKTWDNVLEYTDLLKDLLVDHEKVLPLLISGFKDTHGYRDDSKAHTFLDSILSERLAIRLLCDHHVQILKQYLDYKNTTKLSKEYPRQIGVFDTEFDTCELVRNVYRDQEPVCIGQYGQCPELSVKFKNNQMETYESSSLNYSYKTGRQPDNTFKYIPGPLEYVLKEVLKNAMRAQCKAVINEKTLMATDKLREIKVLVVQNDDGFIIRVSDRGGGLSQEKLAKVWEYNMSEGDADDEDFFNMVNTQGDTRRMFGYGCGLPISKIYCEKLGGTLELQSIPTYGTDVFIRLPYLRNAQQTGKHQIRPDPKNPVFF